MVVPSDTTVPVPWQFEHTFCPVPSHFGHSTSAYAKLRQEKESSPIKRINKNFLFMSLNLPRDTQRHFGYFRLTVAIALLP
jgi:hypothetical protein